MTALRLFLSSFLFLVTLNVQAGLPAPLLATAPDFQIARYADARKNADYVQGRGMTVVQLLPDDNQGRPHQKFVVRLSTGQMIVAISNLDMCPHVPVQVGDLVGLGGQFIWTKDGGIIHWLHHDPRGNRPDGYIEHRGQTYCR